MNNLKPSTSNRVINLKKQQEREKWHKLVVKILSWKDGLPNSASIDSENKITPREWRTYYQHTLEKNVTLGKQKTKEELKKTKDIIEKFGGFAK